MQVIRAIPGKIIVPCCKNRKPDFSCKVYSPSLLALVKRRKMEIGLVRHPIQFFDVKLCKYTMEEKGEVIVLRKRCNFSSQHHPQQPRFIGYFSPISIFSTAAIVGFSISSNPLFAIRLAIGVIKLKPRLTTRQNLYL